MDDDFKELYTPDEIPDPTVKWWSRYMHSRRFDTEEKAREEIFRIRQHDDTQTWSDIFGKDGEAKNRWFADHMPLYQDRHGKWHIGKPLGTWVKEKRHQAYLSRRATEDAEERGRRASHERNFPGFPYYPKIRRRKVQEYLTMTPDFSDGTNGGPNDRPPSTGDFGSEAGLPDYKYAERMRSRDRLRRLIARRDPERKSKNPWDRHIHDLLGESEEEGLGKELGAAPLTLEPGPSGKGMRDVTRVSLLDGRFLGTVFFDDLSPEQKTIPTLKRLWTEYPWISMPNMAINPGRHKTKEEAIARLKSFILGDTEGGQPHSPEFWQRHDAIHAEEQSKLGEGEESFKDVFFTPKPLGWVARRKLVVSPTRSYYVYFARWTERNSNWSQYIGDARIFKRKNSWLKWDGAKRGEWEVIPIYHDPSKYGERALEPETPRRLINYPKRNWDDILGESEDDLVKDVSGPVGLTLDEFARNYGAVPFGGYARNTFHKYIFTKHLHVINKANQIFPSVGGHIWTLLRFRQDPERLLVMVPTDAPVFPGYSYEVLGYALTEKPGIPDNSIAIVNHEILNQV